jgi:nucleotide-binding universal stress UspA family protein
MTSVGGEGKDAPMFTTVVVPLGHSEEDGLALLHGSVLARQAGARLQLMSVRPTYVDLPTVRDHLRQIAHRVRVEAEVVVAGPGDVAATLSEVAADPDTLMCLHTRARGPVAEMVMGSVSEQVVRTSEHPVVLIGPHCAPPPIRYESLIVGLDGSALAERILPTAQAWATHLDVTPWLVHVMAGHVPLETGDDDEVTEAGYVHNVAARLADEGVKAEWETVRDRDPAAAIVRFAEDQAKAMVALTTHGRSGLARVALGGVAFQVAHRATCPVLVLRPSPATAGHDQGRP